jgi:hypothetical protein
VSWRGFQAGMFWFKKRGDLDEKWKIATLKFFSLFKFWV